jgi:hypothetical protein
MAIAPARGSEQSRSLLSASRRMCSLVDSIFDKIVDSRELGRKILPMVFYLHINLKLIWPQKGSKSTKRKIKDL